MNRTKIPIALLAAVSAIAAVLLLRNQSAPPKKEVGVAPAPTPSAPVLIRTPAATSIIQRQTEKLPLTGPVLKSAQPTNPQSITPQNQSAPADEPHQDQMARAALSLVGTGDPDAEAYWMDAIFDSSLSDHEREDLMEDLNEEGLSDPRHPGPQDLPLIVNRLAIIEQVAPYADPFMLEHLGEAYKDLFGMLNGRPPQ